jgi:hypothetical protein
MIAQLRQQLAEQQVVVLVTSGDHLMAQLSRRG